MNSRIIPVIAAAGAVWLAAGCASPPAIPPASTPDRTTVRTLPYTELSFPPPIRGVQPVLTGSINGVAGHFVVDTGAMAPILTQTAIKRCGIATAPSEGFAAGVGGRIAMRQASDVTVCLAPDYSIHWQTVLVLPQEAANPAGTNGNIFGVLDYNTFAAAHAVMDMEHKTITLRK